MREMGPGGLRTDMAQRLAEERVHYLHSRPFPARSAPLWAVTLFAFLAGATVGWLLARLH